MDAKVLASLIAWLPEMIDNKMKNTVPPALATLVEATASLNSVTPGGTSFKSIGTNFVRMTEAFYQAHEGVAPTFN